MGIEWTADLATGVDAIDIQHKELFKRTNALLEACKRGEGRDVVVSTVAFLMQYVVEHFNAEEELMRRAAYAGFAEHAKKHRDFRKTVDELGKDIMEKGVGADTVIQVNRVIVGWLSTHIRRTDREMAAAIRKDAPYALVSHV